MNRIIYKENLPTCVGMYHFTYDKNDAMYISHWTGCKSVVGLLIFASCMSWSKAK